jgi:hypothetical protein
MKANDFFFLNMSSNQRIKALALKYGGNWTEMQDLGHHPTLTNGQGFGKARQTKFTMLERGGGCRNISVSR